MDRVLLVEADGDTCRDVESCLPSENTVVAKAATLADGIRMLRRIRPAFVMASSVLPDGDGYGMLRAVGNVRPGVPVVLLCETLTTEAVFAGAVAGAYDFLAKPIVPVDVLRVYARLASETRASTRCRWSEPEEDDTDEEAAVGRCPRIIEAFRTAGSAAETDATVLVRGESGTGKELMARAVHRASGREGAFVALNCAAVVESLAESELYGHERGAFTGATDRRAGCFERADHGTLFLDEIGEATPAFQAKLLRALDRGEFYRVGGRNLVAPDTRIVAATNRNLEQAVDEGAFRGDLFYRLAEVNIHLPPLRDRRDDIPYIVGRLLSRIGRRLNRRIRGVTEEALVHLVSYRWPGNVRELQNVLTRAALVSRGDTIQLHHLGKLDPRAEAYGATIPTLEELERNHIVRVLEATNWNRGRACTILGVARPTLRRKIRAYGLKPGTAAFHLDTPEGGGHTSPALPDAGEEEPIPVTDESRRSTRRGNGVSEGPDLHAHGGQLQ